MMKVISFANKYYVPCEQKPYKELIQTLREALSNPYYKLHAFNENPPSTILMLQKLCFTLYTKSQIKPAYKEMTEFLGKQGDYQFPNWQQSQKQSINFNSILNFADNFIQSTTIFRESLKKSRKMFHKKILARFKDSYKGLVLWGGFDSLMSKNIPYHKFTLLNKDNELEQTLFVRMGSPTINNDKKTKIAPEFLGYLHYIKDSTSIILI